MPPLGIFALGLFVLLSVPGAGRAESVDAAGFREMISRLQGRVVVVNFWATWCAPCRTEFEALQKLRTAFSEADVAILGVSLDYDSAQYRRFVAEHPFGYPTVLGGEEMMREFGIDAVPHTWIYSAEGRVSSAHSGALSYEQLESAVRNMLRQTTQ